MKVRAEALRPVEVEMGTQIQIGRVVVGTKWWLQWKAGAEEKIWINGTRASDQGSFPADYSIASQATATASEGEY
jgi:hypothetical protein